MKYLMTIALAALASLFIGSAADTEAKTIAELNDEGLIYLVAEEETKAEPVAQPALTPAAAPVAPALRKIQCSGM